MDNFINSYEIYVQKVPLCSFVVYGKLIRLKSKCQILVQHGRASTACKCVMIVFNRQMILL